MPRRKSSEVAPESSPAEPHCILGIDPGLGSTGVGVIRLQEDTWQAAHTGVVTTHAAQPLPARLHQIYTLVSRTIENYQPDCIAVEGIFFAKNVKSAVQMAHGRGVALLAAAESGIPIHELSPLEIKQSVVGKGRAGKEQVARMIRLLLQLPEGEPGTDHESDALACALAWAYRGRILQPIRKAQTRQTTDQDSRSDADLSPAQQLLALRTSTRRRTRSWKK
ncbi:MAG: crossover junction endodeoxyribonuclease RuvC [Candidatus Sumerlaeia bacterium]|nr:crossover junction endodeoxyribonuclease RuvC [Candidatus Sumerlaeia bacterium]